MTLVVKGLMRGGGRNYAHYLQNTKNEQVRVHKIEGTVNTNSLEESLAEMSAYERLTRSENGIFEAIVRPSFDHPITAWDEVIQAIAEKMQLEKQAYAAVIHTYQGSEHMHLMFSRFNIETGKMIELPHYKLKLQEARVDLEQTLGHEHLLSWKEKKELERQERERDEKQRIEREAELKRQFEQNQKEIADKERRKKLHEAMLEAARKLKIKR